jgi:hypothetical protein
MIGDDEGEDGGLGQPQGEVVEVQGPEDAGEVEVGRQTLLEDGDETGRR